MPLFEYECRACGHQFEYLTRSAESPSCPSCSGEDLQKLLSVFAAGGADLIEVEHLREGLDLHVRQTGIHATFAVRTREQAIALVDEARRQGFDVSREGSRAM